MHDVVSSRVCDPAELPLEGLNLIEASAGTGKTYTITALALRMIVEKGIEVDALLVVTFTKAATAELKTRIYERLQEARAVLKEETQGDALLQRLVSNWKGSPGLTKASSRIDAALAGFDRAAVFTIHGWCQRFLQEQGLSRGELGAVDLRADHEEWLVAFAQDHWTRRIYDAPAPLANALYQAAPRCGPESLVSTGKLAMRDPDLRIQDGQSFEGVAKSYESCAETLEALRQRAGMLWSEDPQSLRDYYRSALPKLNKRSNPEALFFSRLDRIFDWFQEGGEGAVDPGLIEALERMSDAGLRGAKGLKKSEVLDSHPAALMLDDCVVQVQALQEQQEELERAVVQDFVQSLLSSLGDEATAPTRCTFDELLLRARALIRDPLRAPAVIEETRKNYQAALIDEFQDTDPAQYEIVSTFWGDAFGALFLVGDPKQAIYRFRGADIHAYLHAREQAKGRLFRLASNFRSHGGMIEAVNAVFSGVDEPFAIPGLEFEAVGQGRPIDRVRGPGLAPFSLSFWQQADEQLKDEWVLAALEQRVRAYLEQGQWEAGAKPVNAGDLAVLCMSNRQARRVRERLEAVGLPTVLRSGQSVWKSAQAVELSVVLQAIVNPGRREALKAALLTDLFGLSLNDLEAMQTQDSAWESWSARFYEWRSIWQERGFLAMWRDLSTRAGVAHTLIERDGGFRALTNWQHLADLAYLLEREERCGPLRLLRRIEAERSSEDGPSEHDELRAADERASIQILTIHKSKGLEFPIVFCPDLYGEKLRNLPRSWIETSAQERRLILDSQDPEAQERYRIEDQSESRRLLYVALTRAKSHCEVFWPAKKPRSAKGAKKAKPAKLAGLAGLLCEHDGQGEDPVAGMQALAAALPEFICASPIELNTARETAPKRGPEPGEAAAPLVVPQEPSAWIRRFGPRVSSYSALARRMVEDGEVSQVEPVGPGHDEAAQLPETLEPTQSLRFSMLAPGAQTGVFVHELLQLALESHVLPDERKPSLERRVRESAQTEERDALVADVLEVLDLEMGIGGKAMRLADLPAGSRAVEVEFLFRCGAFGGSQTIGGQAQPVSFEAKNVAEVLEEHSQQVGLQRYAQRLRARGFGQLHGFLNGFIDLVFEQGGRFFVADYKSNILTGRSADFDPDSLWGYAMDSDYVLQSLIYGVALHRRLQQSIEAYLPSEHLGEALLLFVRGMQEDGSGVLSIRLEAPVIEALDAAMHRGFTPMERVKSA